MEEDRLSTLEQLDQLEELLLDGSRVPLTGYVLVNEREAIYLIDSLRESIPTEITKAYEIINKSHI